MNIKDLDYNSFELFEKSKNFRTEILEEIDGISTWAIKIIWDNSNKLNLNNFISQLSSENRKSSLSPHIDTLRDLTTSKIKLICLYNPWNVNDWSFTWLIETKYCAEIADNFLFYNLDKNLEKILTEVENKIIYQYFITTWIKVNRNDDIIKVYLIHILFANRQLNFENNNKYFYLKDEYTEEVSKSEKSKQINLDGSKKIFLFHNDIMNPKLVHFRYNKNKRQSV